MLAPGFLADLVVLDRDLYTLPPDDILNARVLGTMIGGEWKHRLFD
jgi:predicted amidohydrolase YtcJ